MGGGRKNFLSNMTSAPTSGARLDGLDLIEMWHEDKQRINATHLYVTDRVELMKVGKYSMPIEFNLL